MEAKMDLIGIFVGLIVLGVAIGSSHFWSPLFFLCFGFRDRFSSDQWWEWVLAAWGALWGAAYIFLALQEYEGFRLTLCINALGVIGAILWLMAFVGSVRRIFDPYKAIFPWEEHY